MSFSGCYRVNHLQDNLFFPQRLPSSPLILWTHLHSLSHCHHYRTPKHLSESEQELLMLLQLEIQYRLLEVVIRQSPVLLQLQHFLPRHLLTPTKHLRLRRAVYHELGCRTTHRLVLLACLRSSTIPRRTAPAPRNPSDRTSFQWLRATSTPPWCRFGWRPPSSWFLPHSWGFLSFNSTFGGWRVSLSRASGWTWTLRCTRSSRSSRTTPRRVLLQVSLDAVNDGSRHSIIKFFNPYF